MLKLFLSFVRLHAASCDGASSGIRLCDSTIGVAMPADVAVNDDAFFDDSAILLAALANRDRLVILRILLKGEMSVSALSMLTGIGQSALSQHLTKLRAARLVMRRRLAQSVFYSCQSEDVRQVLQTLDQIWPQNHIKRQSSDGTAAML